MHTRTRFRTVVAMAAALLMLLPAAALAAVEFQQATTAMTGSGTNGDAAATLSISKPTGLAEGDFMLAQITYEKGSDAGTAASFTPAGWTLLDRRNESSDLGQAVFYRFATASEPASYSFTFSQAVKAAGAILRYSGVHSTNPIVAHSANNGQSGTLTATGVNAEADSMAVALFGVKKRTTLTVPSGYTSRVDYANPQDVKIRTADRYFATAAPTGDVQSTPGSGDKWVAHLVVLRQADPPPPTNNAPAYTAADDQIAETGIQKAFDLGSFTDADTHASWSVTVNWGDGTAEETFTVTSTGDLGTRTHTYATAGEKTVTVTVSDGITTGSGTFEVNVTDPVVAPTVSYTLSPAAPNGDNGWHKSGPVTLTWHVTGTNPTLTGCEDQEITADQAKTTYSCKAQNSAGSDEESVEIGLDLSDPTNIGFVGGPADGSTHNDDAVPAAPTCTADDAISGVASCVVTGYSTALGTHTLTATATDHAGRTATATRTYTVVAAPAEPPPVVTHEALFGRPLEPNGVLNSTKLGRVVPVKVTVHGSDGSTDSTGPVSFQTRKVACTNGAGTDTIDEFVAAGASSTGNQFRWDAEAGHWVFNLDTGKIGAKVGECHQLDVYRGGTVTNGTVTGGTHIGSVRLTFTK